VESGRFYGHWYWDYNDIEKSVWERALPTINTRMELLLKSKLIGAAYCGGFTSEEELGVGLVM
jgi:hypothetical protein